ncbi:MAG: iron-containing alcohol dehydrogenase [Anaerolineales bacterium]
MFMEVTRFRTAPVVYFGPGAVSKLEGELHQLHAERVALITDPGVERAGLVQRVIAGLNSQVAVFADVVPEPPVALVDQAVAFIREQRAQAVIGLGGGSSMDTAKMAALMTGNSGTAADYWGVDRVPNPGLPVIAIPTTAGTSSELSPAAVFIDPESRAKKGVNTNLLLARVAILDPELTLGLPPNLTAATGLDALTHAIESYTSPRASLLTDGHAERGIQLIGQHLRRAVCRGDDLEARTGMLAGCFFAGLGLAEVNVGAVHGLAQALGGLFPIGHGLANALLLPYVMAANRIACREKYARVAELLGEATEGLSLDEASERSIEAVRRLTAEVGIPQRLRELNVPRNLLDDVAQSAIETQQRVMTNNPRLINLDEAKALLRAAW